MLFFSQPSVFLGADLRLRAAGKHEYIWLGTLPDGRPIPWRLLSRQGNGGTYRDAAGQEKTGALFLLCGMTLGTYRPGNEIRENFTIPFHAEKNAQEPENPADVWRESDVRAWCAKFEQDCLSEGERAALLATYKSDGVYQVRWYPQQPPIPAAPGILDGDRVFFLSDEEAENTAYGFTIKSNRTAGKEWWTRTYEKTDAALGYRVASIVITNSGGLLSAPISPNTSMYARPAMNLDSRQVLMISAAGMEKPERLTKVPPLRGPREWKLTLLDPALSGLSLGPVRQEGKELAVPYENAPFGEGLYLSAMALDQKGRMVRYGAAAPLKTPAGEVFLDISALPRRGQVFLFTEQRNGGKRTDYAGVPVPLREA